MSEREPWSMDIPRTSSPEAKTGPESYVPTGGDVGKRAEIEAGMTEDRASAEEAAARLRADLEGGGEEEGEEKAAKKPKEDSFAKGMVKLGTGLAGRVSVQQTGGWLARTWDNVFASIEKTGHDELKKHIDSIKKTPFAMLLLGHPIAALGFFLGGKFGLMTPEKTIAEKEIEEKKKKEQEKKKKKKEDEQVQKLEKAGFEKAQAERIRAIQQEAAEAEKEEGTKEEKPV